MEDHFFFVCPSSSYLFDISQQSVSQSVSTSQLYVRAVRDDVVAMREGARHPFRRLCCWPLHSNGDNDP